MLITAGPTHEPIDQVRYIANRSSGRLGLSIAAAAIESGYETTLLLGPAPIQPPHDSHLEVHRFQTTADLEQLLATHWPDNDVLIMAAAVADYRPAAPSPEAKIRRSGTEMVLRLEATPDLLAGLRAITRPGQTVIGFALEPADRLLASARAKLDRKGLDAIVANPLETMDAADVDAVLVKADGSEERSGRIGKAEFGRWLVARVVEM